MTCSSYLPYDERLKGLDMFSLKSKAFEILNLLKNMNPDSLFRDETRNNVMKLIVTH